MHPDEIECLEFTGRDLRPASGQVNLHWRLIGAGSEIALQERFDFGDIGARVAPDHPAIQAALDLLHWIAGVSYWKLACRGEVRFAARRPNRFQAEALTRIYREGLAELAWRNGLPGRYWPEFAPDRGGTPGPAGNIGLRRRALVPMGGGKDSLVALERVRARGIEFETVQVGSAALIGRVAQRAGAQHRVIRRALAPELARLNAAGALNGHVPITAINAAALVLAALLWDFDAVVFANERSADAPTLITPEGWPVNHQFAKSLAFEALFGEWVRRHVATDLDVFSILRPASELGVCREFASLETYHDVFSSCNRNFHLDGPRTQRWCGECPKCRFVFLALAPFMSVRRLGEIFGRDLLAESGQLEGFAALLELDGPRPFECVGEAAEARAALAALSDHREWRDHVVVARLAPRLAGLEVPAMAEILRPRAAHRIPPRFHT